MPGASSTRSFGFTLLVLVTGVLGCAQAQAQTLQRPVYLVGDTWTYRRVDGPRTYQTFRLYGVTQTKTVTRVLPDEFVMATESIAESGEKTSYQEISSLDFNDYVQLSPDQPRQEVKAWKWPVDVGQSWKYELPVKAGIQVWEARAEGWEEVDVPAGKFRALKVVRELISDPGGGKARTATVWFAPEAKVIVKRQDRGNARSYTYIDSERVLLNYKVN